MDTPWGSCEPTATISLLKLFLTDDVLQEVYNVVKVVIRNANEKKAAIRTKNPRSHHCLPTYLHVRRNMPLLH